MKQIFAVLILSLLSLTVYAQPCGISAEEVEIMTQRLIEYKQSLRENVNPVKSGANTYLPVKFHILRTTDGTLGIGEEFVLQQLAELNDDYIDQEIQFYLDDGFNYIDNTAAFQNPSSIVGSNLLRNNKVNGRVNIYIPQTASTGGGSIGTVLGFFSPTSDWIVMRQAEIRNLTTTLTHELGHYLGLLHPHSGWDAAVFNPADHTPTPTISPGGRPTENQARSGACRNCETAGDLLCDTPPDYNFGFGWNDCNYNLGTLDPCGDVVDVQETNFMGYFLRCEADSYIFTENQKQIMDFVVTDRIANNTIFGTLSPDTTAPIEDEVIANNPPEGSTSYQAQSVYFQWEPVPGATDYIFEVALRITGFGSGVRAFLTDGKNDITITEPFLPGREYMWRVYPYNQYTTGAGFSETFSFISGEVTSVAELKEVDSFDIIPNLVNNQSEVLLNINSTSSVDVDVELVNISGQTISTSRRNLITGQNNFDLSVAGLSNGVYFVKLQSDTGLITKKLLVQGN